MSPRKQASSPRAPVAQRRAIYHCSPEHKQHPGTWGSAQWHPRQPELSACPVDIRSDAIPQAWLDVAVQQQHCWQTDGEIAPAWPPQFIYWYVSDRGFFVARRTHLPAGAQPAQYKGYPVNGWEVPSEVADGMLEQGLIDEGLRDELQRARRKQSKQP